MTFETYPVGTLIRDRNSGGSNPWVTVMSEPTEGGWVLVEPKDGTGKYWVAVECLTMHAYR
jgi:hypothetical protein